MDIIHFGPGDLSADMGLDLERELDKLQAAWVRVRDASHKAGKSVLVPANMGFEGGDALALPMELMILRATLGNMLADVRESSIKA